MALIPALDINVILTLVTSAGTAETSGVFVGNGPSAFNAPGIIRDTMLLRSERLALLQTTFPTSHWAIVMTHTFELGLGRAAPARPTRLGQVLLWKCH